ncbi:hypothetical protein ACFL6M_04970 [Candidatus Eisenbacteria bacterium]|uniref:Right handed beta helix domain-containing protein n=1 Tax=Eiseniibacteriota bacterium TaxID=2212470 RepID=A0ABV6YL85_UNCEI
MNSVIRVVMVALVFVGSDASAVVYTVRSDGTGDHPTIQAAVDACEEGDIVELADGTYVGDGNRDITLIATLATIRSQSGNPEACVIDCGGSEEEPHQGIAFRAGGGLSLEGVMIRGGFAITYDDYGGAVSCDLSSPAISNCIFKGNTAYIGGGLACISCSPTIHSCSFIENTALNGGGIDCHYSSPTLTACTFTGNVAENHGGGLYAYMSSTTLTDCVFSANSGTQNGGGCYLIDSTARLEHCTFSGNTTDDRGGGLHCNDSEGQLINCSMYANSAFHGSGACVHSHGSLSIESTVIVYGFGSTAAIRDGSSDLLFTCSNIYGNEGGDWLNVIAAQLGEDGNISEDPLFCGAEGGDFTLSVSSPCASFSPPNEECDLIGAWPVGCDFEILACCVEQECQLTSEEDCNSLGGEWMIDPPQMSCEPNPCLTPVMKTTWGGIKTLFRSGVRESEQP